MKIEEAPPNPLALDPLPPNWPSHGTLHGKSVDLAEAKRTLSPSVLCGIEVDVPGEGVIRPWRGSDYAIGPGGEILF